MIICIGCSGERNSEKNIENIESEGKEVNIGIAMAASNSDYLIDMEGTMKEALVEKGVKYEFLYAEWDAQTQEEQIYSFIEKQVNVIILCPVDTKSLLEVLKKADKEEIPVINLNMKVDAISSEYIDTYVGASSVEEGLLSAQLAVELLGEEGGNIGIIEGEPGSEPARYRTEAFLEELKKYPQIRVVGITCGSWDRDRAYTCAWDLTTDNEMLDLIYAHDSNMAMGAYEALVELSQEQEVFLISIGENDEYIEALAKGIIDGIVTQSSEYEGRTSIYTAMNAMKGVALRPWYKTPGEKLTQSSAQYYKKINY